MTASTIKTLPARLAAKEVSAEGLMHRYLSRIGAGAHLNALAHVDAEMALAQARVADTRIATNNAAPLADIPTAHKDMFVIRGWRTTTGSKMPGNHISPFDVTMVERLGAISMMTLDKTSVDELTMGSPSENSTFGTVKNLWNFEHVPGGSPGGSAVVVAADLVSAATGTDTGGSIRQLASFSNIAGIKPTYDHVSRHGMIAFASSSDQGGPMTRTAEDCALLLSAMAGFDSRDPTGLEPGCGGDTEDFGRLLGQPLQGVGAACPLAGLCIGLSKECFGEGLVDDIHATVRAALAELEKLGAMLVGIGLPKIELSIPTYCVIASVEASSNPSRFDSVCHGHHATKYRDLVNVYCKSHAEGFGWEVKRRILVGAYALSHGYYDAYYLQVQKIRRIIAQGSQNVLAGANRQCNVVMGPVTPTVAWKSGEKTDDPVQICLADIFTLSASLADLPGVSVPAGLGTNGSPVSLQVVDSYFEEARMLQTAHVFQQATDWHHRQLAA